MSSIPPLDLLSDQKTSITTNSSQDGPRSSPSTTPFPFPSAVPSSPTNRSRQNIHGIDGFDDDIGPLGHSITFPEHSPHFQLNIEFIKSQFDLKDINEITYPDLCILTTRLLMCDIPVSDLFVFGRRYYSRFDDKNEIIFNEMTKFASNFPQHDPQYNATAGDDIAGDVSAGDDIPGDVSAGDDIPGDVSPGDDILHDKQLLEYQASPIGDDDIDSLPSPQVLNITNGDQNVTTSPIKLDVHETSPKNDVKSQSSQENDNPTSNIHNVSNFEQENQEVHHFNQKNHHFKDDRPQRYNFPDLETFFDIHQFVGSGAYSSIHKANPRYFNFPSDYNDDNQDDDDDNENKNVDFCYVVKKLPLWIPIELPITNFTEIHDSIIRDDFGINSNHNNNNRIDNDNFCTTDNNTKSNNNTADTTVPSTTASARDMNPANVATSDTTVPYSSEPVVPSAKGVCGQLGSGNDNPFQTGLQHHQSDLHLHSDQHKESHLYPHQSTTTSNHEQSTQSQGSNHDHSSQYSDSNNGSFLSSHYSIKIPSHFFNTNRRESLYSQLLTHLQLISDQKINPQFYQNTTHTYQDSPPAPNNGFCGYSEREYIQLTKNLIIIRELALYLFLSLKSLGPAQHLTPLVMICELGGDNGIENDGFYTPDGEFVSFYNNNGTEVDRQCLQNQFQNLAQNDRNSANSNGSGNLPPDRIPHINCTYNYYTQPYSESRMPSHASLGSITSQSFQSSVQLDDISGENDHPNASLSSNDDGLRSQSASTFKMSSGTDASSSSTTTTTTKSASTSATTSMPSLDDGEDQDEPKDNNDNNNNDNNNDNNNNNDQDNQSPRFDAQLNNNNTHDLQNINHSDPANTLTKRPRPPPIYNGNKNRQFALVLPYYSLSLQKLTNLVSTLPNTAFLPQNLSPNRALPYGFSQSSAKGTNLGFVLGGDDGEVNNQQRNQSNNAPNNDQSGQNSAHAEHANLNKPIHKKSSPTHLPQSPSVFTSLPHPLIKYITRSIAIGLKWLHCYGIVHRDIKPANILVDITTGSVVITDYGSARFYQTIIEHNDNGGSGGSYNGFKSNNNTNSYQNSREDSNDDYCTTDCSDGDVRAHNCSDTDVYQYNGNIAVNSTVNHVALPNSNNNECDKNKEDCCENDINDSQSHQDVIINTPVDSKSRQTATINSPIDSKVHQSVFINTSSTQSDSSKLLDLISSFSNSPPATVTTSSLSSSSLSSSIIKNTSLDSIISSFSSPFGTLFYCPLDLILLNDHHNPPNVASYPGGSIDVYSLGCIIFELFFGTTTSFLPLPWYDTSFILEQLPFSQPGFEFVMDNLHNKGLFSLQKAKEYNNKLIATKKGLFPLTKETTKSSMGLKHLNQNAIIHNSSDGSSDDGNQDGGFKPVKRQRRVIADTTPPVSGPSKLNSPREPYSDEAEQINRDKDDKNGAHPTLGPAQISFNYDEFDNIRQSSMGMVNNIRYNPYNDGIATSGCGPGWNDFSFVQYLIAIISPYCNSEPFMMSYYNNYDGNQAQMIKRESLLMTPDSFAFNSLPILNPPIYDQSDINAVIESWSGYPFISHIYQGLLLEAAELMLADDFFTKSNQNNSQKGLFTKTKLSIPPLSHSPNPLYHLNDHDLMADLNGGLLYRPTSTDNDGNDGGDSINGSFTQSGDGGSITKSLPLESTPSTNPHATTNSHGDRQSVREKIRRRSVRPIAKNELSNSQNDENKNQVSLSDPAQKHQNDVSDTNDINHHRRSPLRFNPLPSFGRILTPLQRNLLSWMLAILPQQRPSIGAVLKHLWFKDDQRDYQQGKNAQNGLKDKSVPHPQAKYKYTSDHNGLIRWCRDLIKIDPNYQLNSINAQNNNDSNNDHSHREHFPHLNQNRGLDGENNHHNDPNRGGFDEGDDIFQAHDHDGFPINAHQNHNGRNDNYNSNYNDNHYSNYNNGNNYNNFNNNNTNNDDITNNESDYNNIINNNDSYNFFNNNMNYTNNNYNTFNYNNNNGYNGHNYNISSSDYNANNSDPNHPTNTSFHDNNAFSGNYDGGFAPIHRDSDVVGQYGSNDEGYQTYNDRHNYDTQFGNTNDVIQSGGKATQSHINNGSITSIGSAGGIGSIDEEKEQSNHHNSSTDDYTNNPSSTTQSIRYQPPCPLTQRRYHEIDTIPNESNEEECDRF